MNAKKIVSAVLLLFVAVSIVVLIARQTSETSRSSGSGPVEGAGQEDTSRPPDAGAGQLQENRVIVYYFHGNVRCPTCLTLEAYSKEAVETSFADALQSGRIQWQVVNFDETVNEHFLRQYDLSFQSLVLVEIKDGREAGHENLEKIWELVGDKAQYFGYVKQAIDSVMTQL